MNLAELTVAVHHRDLATVELAFDADDPSIRSVALSGLHKLAALDPRHIALALTDTDRSVRHRLAEIGAVDERVDLLALLNDEDFAVAETAAWAIGERNTVGELELQAVISYSAGHPHALVRESCVAALGSIGDARGLPAILHAYNDKPAVRRRAVLSLAPFSGPEVEAVLRTALEDRDWQVRQTAEDLLAD